MASYLIFLLSVAIVFCKVHLNTIQKGVEDENSYVTKKLFEGTIKNLTDLILTSKSFVLSYKYWNFT